MKRGSMSDSRRSVPAQRSALCATLLAAPIVRAIDQHAAHARVPRPRELVHVHECLTSFVNVLARRGYGVLLQLRQSGLLRGVDQMAFALERVGDRVRVTSSNSMRDQLGPVQLCQRLRDKDTNVKRVHQSDFTLTEIVPRTGSRIGLPGKTPNSGHPCTSRGVSSAVARRSR